MIPAAGGEVFLLVRPVLTFAKRNKRDMNRRFFYSLPYQLFKQPNTKCIDRSRLDIMAALPKPIVSAWPFLRLQYSNLHNFC